MTDTTDELGWTVPTPGDETEAGEWGSILNATLNNDIEPDVAEALRGGGEGAIYASDQSGANGGEQIQAAIDEVASTSGDGVVVVDAHGPDDASALSGSLNGPAERAWLLREMVTIPDGVHIVFYGSYVILDDDVNETMFQNADIVDGNERITLEGVGRAILDGNAEGQAAEGELGLPQEERAKYGSLWNMVNVDDARIDGLYSRMPFFRTSTMEGCDRFVVNDITFDQYSPRGVHQGGIIVFGPAKRIQCTNLRGHLNDDVINFAATDTADGQFGNGGDIVGATASNIDATRQIRIETRGQSMLKDVHLENINAEVERAVYVGGGDGIGPQSIENVRIDGAKSRSGNDEVIRFTTPAKNVVLSNLQSRSNTGLVRVRSGATLEDLVVTDSVVSSSTTQDAIHIDGGGSVTGAHFNDVYVNTSGNCLYVAGTLNNAVMTDWNVQSASSILSLSGNETTSGIISDIYQFDVDTAYPDGQGGFTVS